MPTGPVVSKSVRVGDLPPEVKKKFKQEYLKLLWCDFVLEDTTNISPLVVAIIVKMQLESRKKLWKLVRKWEKK